MFWHRQHCIYSSVFAIRRIYSWIFTVWIIYILEFLPFKFIYSSVFTVWIYILEFLPFVFIYSWVFTVRIIYTSVSTVSQPLAFLRQQILETTLSHIMLEREDQIHTICSPAPYLMFGWHFLQRTHWHCCLVMQLIFDVDLLSINGKQPRRRE